MMVGIFKAFRPINLLILLLVQILTSYFLGFGNSWALVFNKIHISIYSVTILSAIFGYLVNDLLDINTDAINHPEKLFLKNSKYKKLTIYSACAAVGLAIFISFFVAKLLGLIVLMVNILLMLYSLLFKKLPLIGNVVIALLGAFSIIILWIFDPHLNNELIFIFSVNAFGIHLIREIIKDAEDVVGDQLAQYKTFPIIAGPKATRILLITLLFIYILIFTTTARLMMVHYYTSPLSIVFLTYNILCIGLPLFYLLSQLQITSEQHNYSILSKVALYIMITGTLSMMFF